MQANGKFGPELTQIYAAFYLMISSKDFLERLLNDEAQSVDKSNTNVPKIFLLLTKWVIYAAPNLCNLLSHDPH